ncbi:oxidoreductase [Diaminobutyricimonas sp. TR449]|uniref:FAD-dependent oxidoreductase n=1 Tax=Diaminobutyricimonas sp. TR449 TaxID=2708076 RepID=UPI001FB8EF5F|nr:oxidoreductase [Diaminobutyricimonas sp. TR449]
MTTSARALLDRFTGRISMYLLILVILSVLAVVAFVLALTGELGFDPLAMLASAAVLIVATTASGWLLARLFRTRAHLQSSLISALLLFFLFFPTTALPQLGSLALAGVIASVSKYALAVGGRHVFNPAAIAAFVVTIFTGLNASVWWVATAWLLPFAAIGAFLVLWRTRKLLLGVAFIIVAAMITVTRLVDFGTDPGTALVTAFTSYPIVFLAGFMLSEPLTLPPRRWQQVLIAVVVAVVFAVPFNIGGLYNTPELALLVGNLIAFFFGQRHGLPLEFLGRRQLTPTSWEFSFKPGRAARFTPGQYLELFLPHRADLRGSRRLFSITSATPEEITIGVKISEPASSFKLALQDLAPGEIVRSTGVGGDFVLPRDESMKVLLVAGGIGVTPFVSQLSAGPRRNAVLVYSVSSADELAFAPKLAASGARVLVIAPERFAALPDGWEYLGPGHLTADRLRQAVPDVAERAAYVSGSPAFVDGIRRVVRAAGARRLRTDLFAGY